MSMICYLRRASDARIDHLLRSPREVTDFLYGPETVAPGFWRRLFGAGQKIDQAIKEWSEPSEDEQIDLDKTWHGLHYLLTGTAWDGEEPLCFLAAGGTEIGDVDVGYGPARAWTSQQVKSLAAALSGIAFDDLRARFDPARMTELDIYPGIWDRDPGDDDTLGYLEAYFDPLKEFVEGAAKQNHGLIIYLA